MQVSVRLFGAVREAAGVKELCVDLPDGARVQDLRALLAREHPIFETYGERLMVSINQVMADASSPLAEGDEVAFLPPVAGGAKASEPPEPARCVLSDRPLDVAAVVKRVSGPGMGGIVTFIGAVRSEARGHEIRYLEYEAYPGMAEREMEKIVDTARQRWPSARVAMAHRHGHLEVGDLAVVVAAAAPHRAEAFDACRFAIDTLKQTVPIWKKEVSLDGEYWVDDHA